jgi:hypothetical protein
LQENEGASADKIKIKTGNPETRRKRRKKSEEKSEEFRVYVAGIGINPTIFQAHENVRSTLHPLKSSDFSSDFFLRFLRVSGFLVLTLILSAVALAFSTRTPLHIYNSPFVTFPEARCLR